MVIVAASNKYKINVKKTHSFRLNTWGGQERGEIFLKMKIITAISTCLDH